MQSNKLFYRNTTQDCKLHITNHTQHYCLQQLRLDYRATYCSVASLSSPLSPMPLQPSQTPIIPPCATYSAQKRKSQWLTAQPIRAPQLQTVCWAYISFYYFFVLTNSSKGKPVLAPQWTLELERRWCMYVLSSFTVTAHCVVCMRVYAPAA